MENIGNKENIVKSSTISSIENNSTNKGQITILSVDQTNNSQAVTNDDEIVIVKCSEYYKKKIFKIITKKELFGFLIAYILYILSLEKCYEGEDVCSARIYWIFRKVIEEILSCFILAIMLQVVIFGKISRLHLIHIVLVFLLLLIYSHGELFHDHGYLNFIFYFLVLLIFTILIFPVVMMVYCIKRNKNNKICIYIYVLFFISFFSFIFFYFVLIPSDCKDWVKGLNNTSLYNNKDIYGCQIQLPKKCAFKTLSKYQDFTKIKKKNCKTYRVKKPREKILKLSKSPFISNNTTQIGYPLTNKDPICYLDFFELNNLISEYFFKNLVDMNNTEILEKHYKDKKPEVYVDFNNNEQGKLVINLQFNKTLSEERKLLENKENPYSNNILYLYIDSVSRVNSLRSLKKTLKFFEKFMPYKGLSNEKYPSENYHSFQFFKYHSFKGNTYSNYPRLFFGARAGKDNITLITKHLKENGYITSYVHDYCDKDNTRLHHNYTIDEIYDHQFLLCDPNNEFVNLNEIRCLYGKQNFEHLYEYTNQFWRKYKNNRKFAVSVTNYGHEETLNVLKYSDDAIYNFLNNLYEDGLFKDSTIFLISDHGASLPSVYYIYDFFLREIDLPMLYLIINDRKNITYEEQYGNIYINQQNFITSYDIYNTIGNIAYGDNYVNIKNKTTKIDTAKSENGISLFDKINSKERRPHKYYHLGYISEYSCK